jgi:protein ImuB
MPLGSAHRLAPDAAFLPPDVDGDRASLEAALDRLAAFSPGIVAPVHPGDPAFGAIEIQVDGLERLWGPEPVLVERLRTAVAPVLPGRPRAGIAGTRFAATIAAAVSGPDRLRSVPPGADREFLAPFPAELLSSDREVGSRLARFGLRRIGAVAELPRSALVARFGPEGELLRARARGEEVDPFRPRRTPERLSLALPLEPAIEELESLRFVLHRLVAALADQLAARGAAASRARLRLELDRSFAPTAPPSDPVVDQRLPEPTAETEAIERLLVARLERTPPAAPVGRLELELLDVEPAAGQQLPLFVPQALRSARLAWQLARLGLTYGEDRVGRVELTDPEAPLPETRWRWLPAADGGILPDADERASSLAADGGILPDAPGLAS